MGQRSLQVHHRNNSKERTAPDRHKRRKRSYPHPHRHETHLLSFRFSTRNKKASNVWINEKGLTKSKFEWQEGYGAFSYSYNAIDNVIAYINNQKEHHRKKTFQEEYLVFLENYQIEYKDEYLFEWLDSKTLDT